jgi:hypothetical protein
MKQTTNKNVEENHEKIKFETTMSLFLNGNLIETKLVREREYRHIFEAIAYETHYIKNSTGYETFEITKDDNLGAKFQISHLDTGLGLAEAVLEIKRGM